MDIKKLTPAETASLWNSYLTNTMAVWVTQYFINTTQDEELHSVLKYAKDIAKIEVENSKRFLEESNHPLPRKFDKEDVDLNAPAICTDKYTLIIKYSLSQSANVVYSLSLNTSTRKDIREFYQDCLNNSAELYNRLADLMVKKGLHHPEIHIPTPNHVEQVMKQSYLAGWFADRRPVNSQEINLLEFNFRSTEFHKTFMEIFAQITSSDELQKHFQRGVEMFEKQMEIFQFRCPFYAFDGRNAAVW